MSYRFGDAALARERLAIVADVFAGPTRSLLADLPDGVRRYVLDLGCGPGHTTKLLCEAFPFATVTGIDTSAAMIAEARERAPTASFCVGDVTAPLQLPADVAFARLLVGHLRQPHAALANWAKALRPGHGVLVSEEPVRYRSADEWMDRYERAVTSVVATAGATLWAAPALDRDPPGCERVLDRVVEHPVPLPQVGAMFWRNAVHWADDVPDGPALVEHFREVEREGSESMVTWEIRQAAFSRRG